ncbi:MAG TPA: DUF3783 domain-containing protein [Methanomicrobia archaeon]|nr:DUF3783 domain-containing protein [Methanomicrobia archaeon]
MIIFFYNNAKIKIYYVQSVVMKKGVLLYGFGNRDAEDLKTQIEHAIASPVTAWGAPPDDETVLPILEETVEGQFEDAPDRCVMFVGFEGSEIQKVLRSVEFPPPVSPLFCCPTETNVTWPFRELIEHLKEEREEIENSRSHSC